MLEHDENNSLVVLQGKIVAENLEASVYSVKTSDYVTHLQGDLASGFLLDLIERVLRPILRPEEVDGFWNHKTVII